VIYDGEPLVDEQAGAVYHVLSLVSGNRPRHFSREAFADDGNRIWLEIAPGPEAPPGQDAPFGWNTFVPHPRRIGPMLEATVDLEFAGFPIDVVLHHIHDANDGFTETAFKNLLFAVHTSFEAFAILKGSDKRINDDKTWVRQRELILEAIRTTKGQVEESILNGVLGQAAHANNTPGNQRQREFFAALEIPLTDRQQGALQLRNTLFHSGFIRPRLNKLAPEDLQERFNQLYALRALVNMMALKLMGYVGPYQDKFVDGAVELGPLCDDVRRVLTPKESVVDADGPAIPAD
jgi:hypothetical protein